MKRLSITRKCGHLVQHRPSFFTMIPKKTVIMTTTLKTGIKLSNNLFSNKYMYTTTTNTNQPQTTTQAQNTVHTTVAAPRIKDKNIVEQNKKLGLLYKQKKLAEAEAMFNDMLENNRFDIDSFNMMMDLYEDQNLFDKTKKLLDKALSLGLQPDHRTYGPILRHYYKTSSFEFVINFWNRMLKEKIPISPQNINIVMNSFYRSQRYEEVLDFYKYMQQYNFADQTLYNNLINAAAFCGRTDMVHELYQEMLAKGIIPNLKTFYGVFNALAQVQDDQKLEYYNQEMETYHVKENGMLYKFQLEYHAKRKDYVGVMDTLVKVESDPTVKMTETFVRILVDSIGQCDRPQDMINYVSSIEGAGVPPYIEVYITIIKHLNRLAPPQNAIQMYNIVVNHKKLKPTPELWNLMLKVYARAKDKDGINAILEQFRKKHLAPDLDALNAAMEVEGK